MVKYVNYKKVNRNKITTLGEKSLAKIELAIQNYGAKVSEVIEQAKKSS